MITMYLAYLIYLSSLYISNSPHITYVQVIPLNTSLYT